MMMTMEGYNPEFLEEATNKATAKKPYYTGTLTHRAIHCPTCESVLYSTDNYCRFCGQKIEKDDWRF